MAWRLLAKGWSQAGKMVRWILRQPIASGRVARRPVARVDDRQSVLRYLVPCSARRLFGGSGRDPLVAVMESPDLWE